ncbi:MAG: hypothetical protein ACRC4M_04075 [Mycoplasma sp.]
MANIEMSSKNEKQNSKFFKKLTKNETTNILNGKKQNDLIFLSEDEIEEREWDLNPFESHFFQIQDKIFEHSFFSAIKINNFCSLSYDIDFNNDKIFYLNFLIKKTKEEIEKEQNDKKLIESEEENKKDNITPEFDSEEENVEDIQNTGDNEKNEENEEVKIDFENYKTFTIKITKEEYEKILILKTKKRDQNYSILIYNWIPSERQKIYSTKII